MKVRKAVITAAGWGTRLLPATKAQPKETLPLVDKPLIQAVVEEAASSGIRQIIIVTASGKSAIEDHFDRNLPLEQALEKKGDSRSLAEVRRVSELAGICYVRQKEQLGLGHAVLVARDLVGDEPFALFLPDDLIAHEVPCMQQMLEVFERYQASVIAVERVPQNEVERYGIIDPVPMGDRVYRIKDLVEKPPADQAPSNLGIVGRYVLTPEIFSALERTPPGKGGEIQLTDGIRILLQEQSAYGYEFLGTRYDTGTPLGLLKASVDTALKRPDMGPEFRRYLQERLREPDPGMG